MSTPHIYFVAAEASGDLLAREVIEAIRAKQADVRISGIGGKELAAAGITSPIDISSLSILGFLEGIKAYGDVVKLVDAAADAIVSAAPDVVVLVDSWGFMLRVAQRLRIRAPQIRLVKLIGPQVWATRPGRAKTLAGIVDHLLCMHYIEVPFYEPFGLRTTVIGNPALSRGGAGNRTAFRAEHGLVDTDMAVLILPGSRRSEIARVAPALVDAALRIKAALPRVRLFAEPADSVAGAFKAAFPNAGSNFTVLENPARRFDAMAGSDLVLACSGTVTSEVAKQGAPMIVAYKTGWVTWALARGLLYKKKHITLLNILNDDSAIVPEFVQTRQKADLIAAEAIRWLSNPEILSKQRAAQRVALGRLQNENAPAAEIAAGAILSELGRVQRAAIGM